MERTGRQRRAIISYCAGPPFTKSLDCQIAESVPWVLEAKFKTVENEAAMQDSARLGCPDSWSFSGNIRECSHAGAPAEPGCSLFRGLPY